MKINDLKEGEVYRTSQGRTVLLVSVGEKGNRFQYTGGMYRRVPRQLQGANGVLAAMANTNFISGGRFVPTAATSWHPVVLQASQIEATFDDAAQQDLVRREQRQQIEQRNHERYVAVQALVGRSRAAGATRAHGVSDGYGVWSVAMSVEDLTTILDTVEGR